MKESDLLQQAKAEIGGLNGQAAWERVTQDFSGSSEEIISALLVRMVEESSGVSVWFEPANRNRPESLWTVNVDYQTWKSKTLKFAFARAWLFHVWYLEQAKK